MPIGSVSNWGQAIQTSVASALAILLAGIPKIIGFLVILIVGWIIASLLAKAVAALLRAIKFDQLAERAGISTFVRDMGVTTDAAGVVADIAKWFVRLIVLVAAFDALGLPVVASLLNRLLLWVPNLVVALLVLVIGGLIAKALSELVRGAVTSSGIGNPNVLSAMTSVAVWGFAFLVAVNQIGVASSLINILFMGFVGALALAFGLAFGLGARDTAGQMVAQWYQSSRQNAPQLQQAAQTAATQAQQQGQSIMAETRPSSVPAGTQNDSGTAS